MKKLILFSFIYLVSVLIVSAQQLKEGSYHKIPELQRFEGAWIYTHQLDTFKIILDLRKVFLKGPNVYIDQLYGNYIYIHKGRIVSNVDTIKTIQHGGVYKPEPNRLTFEFIDRLKGIKGSGVLELLHGKTDEAVWTLYNKEEPFFVPGRESGHLDYTFSVPVKAILKKVH
ncbi:MAG: DUF6705 family protein [Daejeonella sp.]